MGKGYEENQARLKILSSFGKDLARRAKSTCELSGQSGISLKIYEVPPTESEPDFERCLFLSEDTITALERPQSLQADQWRHLGELIWSDIPMVQLMTVRLLNHLSSQAAWCASIIEDAYLDEELLAEAESVPLGK